MNDLHKADQAKIKQLNQFHKAFKKLAQKYPDVMMFGDRDGDVYGYVSLVFTTLGQKDNKAYITSGGKVIQ